MLIYCLCFLTSLQENVCYAIYTRKKLFPSILENLRIEWLLKGLKHVIIECYIMNVVAEYFNMKAGFE